MMKTDQMDMEEGCGRVSAIFQEQAVTGHGNNLYLGLRHGTMANMFYLQDLD